MDADDATLLAAVAAGDPAATAALLRRYGPLVACACRRRLAGADAEDAAQAVFLVLWRRARDRSIAVNLPGWLVLTANHVCATMLRAAARRRRHEREAAMSAGGTAAGGDGEARALLDQALAALPAAERDIIVRRHLLGESPEAVAAVSGCAVGTVHSRTSRGLERLRAWYGRHGIACTGAGVLASLAAASRAMESTAPPLATPSEAAVRIAGTLAGGATPIAMIAGVIVLLAAILGTILTSVPAAVGPAASPPPDERIVRLYGLDTYLWRQQVVYPSAPMAVGRPVDAIPPQTPLQEDVEAIATAGSWRDLQAALQQVLRKRDPSASLGIAQPGMPDADLLAVGVERSEIDALRTTLANTADGHVPGLDATRILLAHGGGSGLHYLEACIGAVHERRRAEVFARLGADGLADARELAAGLRAVVDVTAAGLGIAPRSAWPATIGKAHLPVTWIPEERIYNRPMAAARSHGGTLIAVAPRGDQVYWIPDERVAAAAEVLRRRLDQGPNGRIYMSPHAETAPPWVAEGEWASAVAEVWRQAERSARPLPHAAPPDPGF